jgi:hypothetical protein
MRGRAFTAAVAFALGVAVTLLVSGNGDEPRTAARRATPRAAESEATVRIEERLRESETERVRLQTQVETLERELLEARAARERARAETAGPSGGPRFRYPETDAALRGLDWTGTGEALAKLMPLLSEAVDVIHGKRPLRPELFGEITRWSGPLYTHGSKLDERDVAWSHPSALANLIHATLVKAGQPLGRRQEDDLYRIGLLYVEQDQLRRAGYADGETLRLRRLIDAVRLQDRFYAEVEKILTTEQKAVLYPPGVRGIVQLDVFAGSLVWEQRLDRVSFKDRAELRERMVETFAAEFKLRDRRILACLVEQWDSKLPDSYLLVEPDAVRKEKMEYADQVNQMANLQQRLLELLLDRPAELNAEERRRVLEWDRVLMPYWRP